MHGTRTSTRLSSLPAGKTASIRMVEGSDFVSQQLLESGLVPGTEVKVLATGTVVTLMFRGATVALRRGEAMRIIV